MSLANIDRNKKMVREIKKGLSYRKAAKKYNLHFTRVREIYLRDVDKY